MRTAIKTYQSGGVVEPDQPPSMLFPPLQGVTPEVTPAPVPDTIQQPPSTAIQTAPPFPQPRPEAPAEIDHDADMPQWQATEAAAFKPVNIASHRGDNRFIGGEKPTGMELQDHPEYPKFEEMKQVASKIADRRSYNAAHSDLKAMETRLRRETDRQNAAEQKAFFGKERSELQKADATSIRLKEMPEIDQQIDTSISNLQKTQQANLSAAPQLRQKSEQYLKVSPLATMGEEQRRAAIRRIAALNAERQMSIPQATGVLFDLATPVDPNSPTPPINGLKGRAAADYKPRFVDVIGNRLIETRGGMVRVDPDTYKAITNARNAGYNAMLKHQKELAAKRADQDKPGPVGQAFDWVGRQFQ